MLPAPPESKSPLAVEVEEINNQYNEFAEFYGGMENLNLSMNLLETFQMIKRNNERILNSKHRT